MNRIKKIYGMLKNNICKKARQGETMIAIAV